MASKSFSASLRTRSFAMEPLIHPANRSRSRANASAPGLERFGGQQQWYDPSECRVAGGALALRTRRRKNGGDFFLVPGAQRRDAEEYPFVSCWVDTKKTFSQTYGRVEIRARFPDHACPGVWPQHWMLPAPETSVPSAPADGDAALAEALGGLRVDKGGDSPDDALRLARASAGEAAAARRRVLGLRRPEN